MQALDLPKSHFGRTMMQALELLLWLHVSGQSNFEQ